MNLLGIHLDFARLAVAIGCLAVGTAEAAAQEVPDPNNPVGTTLIAAPNTFRSNQGPLPSVDAALAQAVENSPDVAAAKAKLALAEAELASKRLEVSRQVLSDYSTLNNFGTQSEALKAKLQAATAMLDIEKQRFNAGTSADAQSEVIKRQAEVQELKAQLAQVASQADATVRELRMLLGSKLAVSEFRSPTSATLSSPARRSQMPQGPVVERIKLILDEITNLEFSDVPLKDALDYISAKHKLPVYIHPSLYETGMLINLTLKDVPLRYAFEGIQELAKDEVCFVVRDYGVLIATKDIADQNGYVSAVDFGRGEPSAKVPVTAAPQPGTTFDPPRQGSTFKLTKPRSQDSDSSRATEPLNK